MYRLADRLKPVYDIVRPQLLYVVNVVLTCIIGPGTVADRNATAVARPPNNTTVNTTIYTVGNSVVIHVDDITHIYTCVTTQYNTIQ